MLGEGNNNKKNDESDTTKADVTSLVFQNVVNVMGYVKREKRIHDNLERFTRIMFTLISSENLLKNIQPVTWEEYLDTTELQ